MKKETKILHLTHTNVYNDNRILKQLEAISSKDLYDTYAVGVLDSEKFVKTNRYIDSDIKIISLITKKIIFLPKFIRHILNLFEMFFPMLFYGLRVRPEIIHCHDTLVLPVGFLISFFTNSKIIYDAHELESDKNGQTQFLSKSTYLIEKICWPRISGLISVSPSILNWYNNEFGSKKNALILNAPLVPTDSTVTSTKYPKTYFRDLYNIPENRLVFIYLGLLENGRGIDMLLKAFANSVVQSHLVFVGSGGLEGKITSVTNENQNVHLHQPVPHEDVVNLVKGADVGLCIIEKISLSDYYCLPNKLFEYCFSGLPVLASNFPDIVDIVSRHKLGMCTQVDLKSVIEALKEIELTPMSFNPEKMSKLSWNEQSNRLVQLYAEILEEACS